MDDSRSPRQERKLDQAARAAWLYYIAGNTQDEIAAKLEVSRQAAQRLVSLAVAEKLIKFRLDHPLAECMALAEALRDRHGLAVCEVTLADPAKDDPAAGIAVVAAEHLAGWLASKAPQVLAFSTGRTLRATVAEVQATTTPQHKLVSLIGAVSRDGQVSGFEVVMRLADLTGAQCFPMTSPVVAKTTEECALLRSQHSYAVILELARQASVALVGIGDVGWRGPIHRDGLVTDAEIAELLELGAVGEIAGWAFDAEGRLIEGGTNARVAGIPLAAIERSRIVAVGGGAAKVAAIRAALRGGLLNGLITDERTARAVLAPP